MTMPDERTVSRASPTTSGARDAVWPSLPLAEWADTLETLHRWTQLPGKTRLALSPPVNHWWHVTLRVGPRGLATPAIPYGGGSFDVAFDFIDHQLVVRTSDGAVRTTALAPRSVADFHRAYTGMLDELGIRAHIWPRPMELTDDLSLAEDEVHRSYDPEYAHRCWCALAQAARVLEIFRGRFLGKASPVHFFWGSFDLACTRFNGALAPRHPGGIPHLPDRVVREAYSHACISAGWWPGTPGSAVAEPAFYAYAYPEPEGLATAPIGPKEAWYEPTFREFILPYEVARTAADPDAVVLEFLQSTYEAAAGLAGWDRALERAGEVRG